MLKKLSNESFKRLTSSLVIVVIMLTAIFSSYNLFALVFLAIFIGMVRELYQMTKGSFIDLLQGLVLISFAITSLVFIKIFKEGNLVLFWFFCVIWTFDTFSMIGGKNMGGKKLWENVSPNKTWSGLFCGITFAILVNNLIFMIFWKKLLNYFAFSFSGVILTLIIVILALFGDLLESIYKRKYKIKDSGNLIPGHGGLLDRFDSILLSAPVLLILLML